MKALLVSALLIAAADSSGALAPATGARLVDYTNWYDGLHATAADTVPFQPPFTPAFGSIDNADRMWTGWWENWGPYGLEPIVNPHWIPPLFVEVVFLAETSARLNNWGYSLNGVDLLLAEAMEAGTEGANLSFGDYSIFRLEYGETLDFWFSTIPSQTVPDPESPWVGPATYYAFDRNRNVPPAARFQSYYGMVTPLSSVRDPGGWEQDGQFSPFTVVAFEEEVVGEGSEPNYTDLVFAYRAWRDAPCCGMVPEPASYGIVAAVMLSGLVAWRKRRLRE